MEKIRWAGKVLLASIAVAYVISYNGYLGGLLAYYLGMYAGWVFKSEQLPGNRIKD